MTEPTEEHLKKAEAEYRNLYGRAPTPEALRKWATNLANGVVDTLETPEESGLRLRKAARDQGLPEDALSPDWTGECMLCGSSPIMPATGMCGPCTFGEADTINGNW